MVETIGRVQLNLEYAVQTLCDTEQEKVRELLQMLTDDADINMLVRGQSDYFYLKNLFYGREAITAAMDIGEGQRVLEVGAGCGAVTGRLCAQADSVVCVDWSAERSRINALRHQNCDNLTVYAGDYTRISETLKASELYDVITLIGTVEEKLVYTDSAEERLNLDLSAYLQLFGKNLADGGCIYAAVDNSMGMRYLSGGKRADDTEYFQSFKDTAHSRYTKAELVQAVEGCGFEVEKWIYPYPDYVFPTSFYTDARMPKPGELSEQVPDFESNHLFLFQEGRLYDMLIRENVYDRFATSYLVKLRRAE